MYIGFLAPKAPASGASSGSSSSSSTTQAGPQAIFTQAQARQKGMGRANPDKIPKDFTQYSWPVNCQMMYSGRQQFPPGPVHLQFDGVGAHVVGEVNQYNALAPARPDEGIPELCVWCPIQVHGAPRA